MKNKKDNLIAKEKNEQIKSTSSDDKIAKSSDTNNSSHPVIPTTVVIQPKIECVETVPTHEQDVNSYGKNMYYSYDQSLPSFDNFSNLLPVNNNRFDYYNSNNDYIGQKGQCYANAPLNDNMFNYYDILDDLNNNMFMMPPNEPWVPSMFLNSPSTGPEMTNL